MRPRPRRQEMCGTFSLRVSPFTRGAARSRGGRVAPPTAAGAAPASISGVPRRRGHGPRRRRPRARASGELRSGALGWSALAERLAAHSPAVTCVHGASWRRPYMARRPLKTKREGATATVRSWILHLLRHRPPPPPKTGTPCGLRRTTPTEVGRPRP